MEDKVQRLEPPYSVLTDHLGYNILSFTAVIMPTIETHELAWILTHYITHTRFTAVIVITIHAYELYMEYLRIAYALTARCAAFSCAACFEPP